MPDIQFHVADAGTPLVPYWTMLTTAGRAAEGLRDEWRWQLRAVQQKIGFSYIRFHGLLHDDMMIYREEADGTPVYNWQYLDSLFDFLLEVGVRPFVELGFMPSALRSDEKTVFWWKGQISPPRDMARWRELVSALVRHCINRYGLQEVRQWYFEVWNEPNLHDLFWSGSQADYFALYQATAQTIKAIDPHLRVGGPATSNFDPDGRAPWVEEFLAYCAEHALPLDFISTHPYPNSWPMDSGGNQRMAYRDAKSTCQDLHWLRNTVDASVFPGIEIQLTEWNSSPSPRDLVHDTAFMAPFIVQNLVWGRGLVDSLGFWTFTDVFEENAAGDTIFHGGFGLINGQGLKKPAFHAYRLLSKLGGEEVAAGDNYIVTRSADAIQVLLWNYCHYTDAFANGDRSQLTEHDRYRIFADHGPLPFKLTVDGLAGARWKCTHSTLDRTHGSVYDAWLAMGAPANPTPDELAYLERQSGPTLQVSWCEGQETLQQDISVAPHGVVLVELQREY